MLRPHEIRVSQQRLQAMKVIAMALPMGAVTAVVIILAVVVGVENAQDTRLGLLPLVALAVAAVALPISFLIPSIVGKAAVKNLADGKSLENIIAAESKIEADAVHSPSISEGGSINEPTTVTGKLEMIFQTRLIIGLALLEGPALICIMFNIIEPCVWLWAAAAFLIFLMVLRFPTESKLQNWICWASDYAESFKRLH